MFSEDIADTSIVAMMHSDKIENRYYNVGIGIDYSIKELAERIRDMVGFKGRIEWDTNKPDGTFQGFFDSSSFFNLGWRPSTTLDHGLQITYTWYSKNLYKARSCQFNCVKLFSANFLRKGRFSGTFPMGFFLQWTSIFTQTKASSV